MPALKRGSCSNTEVVNAGGGRLHSHRYDADGDKPGILQSTFEEDSICFFGICNHFSYNAWAEATDEYIENTLEPQYERVFSEAKAAFGGGPLPVDIQGDLDKVKEFIEKWRSSGIKPDKNVGHDFLHLSPYWEAQVKEIVYIFDQAACLMDSLDVVSREKLGRPDLARGEVLWQPVPPPPSGTFFDGSGGAPPPKRGGSPLQISVGAVALGAAAYFGFKVLTR